VGDKIENETYGEYRSDGEERGVYRGLVGKPEEKKSLGRPRCRWDDNIKMDLQEGGCRGMELGWLRIETNGGHL
jgi:hypothetical protein